MARLANFGGMADRPWHAAAWRPSAGGGGPWGARVAVTMSAELLFQPFVWRNWPWSDVLLAWGELAVRRLEVALALAAALMAAWAIPARSLCVRALLLAVAIAGAGW